MKITYLLILLLSNTFMLTVNTMEKNPLINPATGSSYIPDHSLITFDSDQESNEEPTFNNQKMLSANSLANLKDLQKQGAIHTFKEIKKELAQKGFKIVEQKPLWRRCGAALRRYATTFCVIGTATMVSILFYYFYISKGEIEKVGPFINKAEKFVNKGEQTFNTINEVLKELCAEFHLKICTKLKTS